LAVFPCGKKAASAGHGSRPPTELCAPFFRARPVGRQICLNTRASSDIQSSLLLVPWRPGWCAITAGHAVDRADERRHASHLNLELDTPAERASGQRASVLLSSP
jgi:hypothetical protein